VRPPALLSRWLDTLRSFLFGAAISWIAPPYLLRRRRETERMFVLLMESSLLGIPLLPPRTRLGILPYAVPGILAWKRRLRLWDDSLEMADLKHIGH